MTSIRKILLPIVLVAASAQAQDIGESAIGKMMFTSTATVRGTVLAVSARPAESGIFATGVGILFEKKDKKDPIMLIIPYMSGTQVLPEIGETCTFNFHVRNIEGMVVPPPRYDVERLTGWKSQDKKDGKVVDSFDCGAGQQQVLQ